MKTCKTFLFFATTCVFLFLFIFLFFLFGLMVDPEAEAYDGSIKMNKQKKKRWQNKQQQVNKQQK